MKKRNGFTLIELLAVLIILAIIAIIVFPMIGDVITDSKMKAFRSSVKGLEHTIDLDYQKDYYKGVREYRYENGNLTLLSVKGETKNENIKVEGMIENGVGKLSIDKDGNTSLIVYNDEWCAVKDFTDKTITVEEKTDTNCKELTPEYCFEVQEVAIAESYDINLENCKASFSSSNSYSELDKEAYCTKGQVASDGHSLEMLIQLYPEVITELVNEKIIENVVYTEASSITDYKCYEGNEDGYEVITDVVMPSRINGKSVTTIGSAAFMSNQLTSVVIPNSVITIGQAAFVENNLTSVTFPNSVTTIGDGAFWSNQLTSVMIPDSVTTIGYGAFNDNQLTDDQAFIYARNSDGSEDKTTLVSYGGTKRDNVVIPNSVTTIESDAFSNNQLTSVTIPNSVTTIEDGAFSYNQLTSVTIPNSVTTIGDFAFRGNQLTSVTIPNSVITMGGGVFNDNQLSDEKAFIYAKNSDGSEDETTVVSYGGAKRENVVIPNSVTTIDTYAFYGNQLTSVVIPNSVTTIGNHAFSYNKLTSITIPNSVTTIKSYAFYKASFSNPNLTTIVNTTGRSFDWKSITDVRSSVPFVTGTVSHSNGNITVSSS